jgi:hypothetical protein
VTLENHYVILPNLSRFRSWAKDNIKEEWRTRGHGVILTDSKCYRAIIHLHDLRGATLTEETVHWAEGWYMGLNPRAALELERYVQVCLAAGEAAS